MLKIFRRKEIAKLVLWGILILILPAFVLWGTGNLGRGDRGPKYFGIINNKKVSFDEFGESLTAIRCQIRLNYFNQEQVLKMFLSDNQFLGKLAWDRLIMFKEAKKNRIKVSDKEISDFVMSHPIFLQKGRFDGSVYGLVLTRYMGLDPRSFEEIVRENLQIRKLNDMMVKDVKVTDDEILENYKKDSEKVKISYYLVPTENFFEKASVSDAELKDYYEKNKNEFILPPKEGAGGETKIFANFEDVKESIKMFLTQARARDLAASSAEEAYNNIKSVMDKEKKTFEEACGKLNLKLQETPFFSKTDYIEGFGEAKDIAAEALKLKANEISAPIKTRRGVIIFRVSGIQNFDEETFKKEKEAYSKKLLEKKQSLVLEDWLRRLESNAKINVDLKDIDKYYR